MGFVELLEPLLGEAGVVAAALFDPQGQSIAEVGSHSAIEMLGAYQSVWNVQLAGAASRSGLGALSELAMDFGNRRTISALVQGKYYVVAVFEREAVPALARARLLEVRDRLAAEIG